VKRDHSFMLVKRHFGFDSTHASQRPNHPWKVFALSHYMLITSQTRRVKWRMVLLSETQSQMCSISVKSVHNFGAKNLDCL